MSDTSVLPGSLTVRNLFEDLLGRDCNVAPGDPITAALGAGIGNAMIAIGVVYTPLFARLVRSQALIRLNVSPEVPPCVLALGSRDPEMFHPGMRTELVGFLGRVLERCIRSWLTPAQD